MEHFPNLTPAEIERTTQRLHRVARAWVDDAGARDLAQGAWLKVSAGEFTGIRKLETFLLGVVRNLARKQALSEHRRDHREHQAARPEAIASAAELVERNELAARLATAISELPEPQRAAILLRYDEGLSAVEIAANLGIPPSSVRSRLKRARNTLQLKLQDPNAPRGIWAGFIAALAPKPSASAAGILLIASILKWTIALVAGLLIALGTWRWSQLAEIRLPPETATATEHAEVDQLTEPQESMPRRTLGSNAKQPRADLASSTPSNTPSSIRSSNANNRISGTVSFPDGTLLPEVSLVAKLFTDPLAVGGKPQHSRLRNLARSNHDGQFVFRDLPEGTYDISGANGIPVVGQARHPSGSKDVHLVVNAISVTLQALNNEGVATPIDSLLESSTPFLGLEGSQSYSKTRNGNASRGKKSVTRLIPAYIGSYFHAVDSEDNHYFAIIPPGTAPGHLNLDLTEDRTAFGELRIKLDNPHLPKGSHLAFSLSEPSGPQTPALLPIIRQEGGKLERVVRGLIPGRYKITLWLAESGPVQLADRYHFVSIVAGEQKELILETTIGGVVELTAEATPPLDAALWAKTEIRLMGDQEWRQHNFTTVTDKGPFSNSMSTVDQSKILSDGTKGTSAPLKPGKYEIRVSLKEHSPAIRAFDITSQGKTHLAISLGAL